MLLRATFILIFLLLAKPAPKLAKSYKVETFQLPPPPPLAELAAVLRAALPHNYAQVSVTVQVPPDFTAAPFRFSRPGLSGGQQAIVNVGGPTNENPRYDFIELAKQLRLGGHQFIGAGYGPYFQLGHKAEMIADIFIPNNFQQHPELIRNEGHFADYNPSKNISHVYKYATDLPRLTLSTVADKRTTEFVRLATLYASAGDSGAPVLVVHVARRNGTDPNFVNIVQQALAAHYRNTTTVVALGTVFLVKNNSSRADASKTLIRSLLQYSKNSTVFLDIPVPLVCVGTLTSQHKPEWTERDQHVHCYGPHGGGHYLWEAAGSGDNVEYEAYFQVARKIYRFLFAPIGFETFGSFGPAAKEFLYELGRKIAFRSGEPRSTEFLLQRVSLAIQRGNAASVLGTRQATRGLDEVYYVLNVREDDE